MAFRAKDIYQGRKKSHSRAGVVIFAVLAIFVVAVLIFYGLRHYAVYDESGNATIVLPFSHKSEQSASPSASPDEASPSASPEPSPSASPAQSLTPSPSASPAESVEPSPLASAEQGGTAG